MENNEVFKKGSKMKVNSQVLNTKSSQEFWGLKLDKVYVAAGKEYYRNGEFHVKVEGIGEKPSIFFNNAN